MRERKAGLSPAQPWYAHPGVGAVGGAEEVELGRAELELLELVEVVEVEELVEEALDLDDELELVRLVVEEVEVVDTTGDEVVVEVELLLDEVELSATAPILTLLLLLDELVDEVVVDDSDKAGLNT